MASEEIVPLAAAGEVSLRAARESYRGVRAAAAAIASLPIPDATAAAGFPSALITKGAPLDAVECHTNTVKALDLSQSYLYLQEARREGTFWRGRPLDVKGNLPSMQPLRPLRASLYWAEGIKIDQPLKDWAKGLHDAGDADVATLSTMIEEEAQLAAAGAHPAGAPQQAPDSTDLEARARALSLEFSAENPLFTATPQERASLTELLRASLARRGGEAAEAGNPHEEAGEHAKAAAGGEPLDIKAGAPPSLRSALPLSLRHSKGIKPKALTLALGEGGALTLERDSEEKQDFYLSLSETMQAMLSLGRTHYRATPANPNLGTQFQTLLTQVIQLWDSHAGGRAYAPDLLRYEFEQRLKHSFDPTFDISKGDQVAIMRLTVAGAARLSHQQVQGGGGASPATPASHKGGGGGGKHGRYEDGDNGLAAKKPRPLNIPDGNCYHYASTKTGCSRGERCIMSHICSFCNAEDAAKNQVYCACAKAKEYRRSIPEQQSGGRGGGGGGRGQRSRGR